MSGIECKNGDGRLVAGAGLCLSCFRAGDVSDRTPEGVTNADADGDIDIDADEFVVFDYDDTDD